MQEQEEREGEVSMEEGENEETEKESKDRTVNKEDRRLVNCKRDRIGDFKWGNRRE